jgi:parvulin-like peptidyl-prolyl isomerase
MRHAGSHRPSPGLGALTLGLSLLLTGCSSDAIATVNGQPISRSAFLDRLQRGPAARDLLGRMVEQALLDQYARQHGIVVTAADVDAREAQTKALFPRGSWDAMLKARGLSESEIRAALREQLIMDPVFANEVHVAPAQIKEYFAANHARFDTPARVSARYVRLPTLTLANRIEAEFKAGQSFATLAAVREIARGQMGPAFDAYAFSAPIGRISPPIRSPSGYDVIEVESRVPGTKATLAEVEPLIAEQLREREEAPKSVPFLQKLTQQASIVVNDPDFAGLFTPAPSVPVQTQ